MHQAASHGARRARYRGLPKSRLDHVYMACALNLPRLQAFWTGTPLDRQRTSHLARLELSLALVRRKIPAVTGRQPGGKRTAQRGSTASHLVRGCRPDHPDHADGRSKATAIPGHVRQLLDAPSYVHLSTLRADGSPRNWVVWVGLEDDYILVCTSDAIWKAKDMRRDPRGALSVTDLANPYRMATI